MCAKKSATWEGAAWVRTRRSPARSGSPLALVPDERFSPPATRASVVGERPRAVHLRQLDHLDEAVSMRRG